MKQLKPKDFCVFLSLALGTWISLSAGFHQVPSIVWQVSLVTGRLMNYPTLRCYIPTPFTESFDRLGRRMILPQGSRSGNRTRVTQPELTLVRAPYPLDQHSFLSYLPMLFFDTDPCVLVYYFGSDDYTFTKDSVTKYA